MLAHPMGSLLQVCETLRRILYQCSAYDPIHLERPVPHLKALLRKERKLIEPMGPSTPRMNWMGLTNRPYRFEIIASASTQATVKLEYEAPDVYPAV